jgi:hypothetical protein
MSQIKIINQLLYTTRTIHSSVILSIFVIVAGSCSTTNTKHFHKTGIAELQDNLLVDSDGNKYSAKKLLDNNLWMATANDGRTAWFANFGKSSQSLYLQMEGEKTDAFAVRCLRNIDTLNKYQ